MKMTCILRTTLKLIAFLTILLPHSSNAQDVEMADALVANGKIYVVVSVLLVLLAGIFIYLIRLDRRMSRLEKRN
jgi:hypothetical protein